MMKIFLIWIAFFAVSALMGSIPIIIAKEKQAGFLKAVLYGNIIMLVLFELIVIPMTIMGQSLTRLTLIWICLIGVISLIAIVIAKSFFVKQIKSIRNRSKNISCFDGFIIILICIQIFICVKYVFLHANDAYYVGMTTTTLTTNQLLSYSPYTGANVNWENYKSHLVASLPVYWAMLAKIFGVTGAFMCHSVVPALFIPIGYILYREIGLLLFKQERSHVNLFLIIICVGNFFIGKNYDTSYEMLTTAVWQGGTFLYNIVLPGIFYFEFKFLRKNHSKLDLLMIFMMLIVGIMTVPKSGIVLSVLTVILLGISFGVERILTKRKRIDAGINI